MSDYGDPEPPDENDPEFKRELFETFRALRTKPEDLIDPHDAAEYAEWLKEQTED
jgi:hypothetical protein